MGIGLVLDGYSKKLNWLSYVVIIGILYNFNIRIKWNLIKLKDIF